MPLKCLLSAPLQKMAKIWKWISFSANLPDIKIFAKDFGPFPLNVIYHWKWPMLLEHLHN